MTQLLMIDLALLIASIALQWFADKLEALAFKARFWRLMHALKLHRKK